MTDTTATHPTVIHFRRLLGSPVVARTGDRVGRLADLVKLGGKRASLAELNRTLAGVQGVVDGVFVAPEDLDSNPTSRLTAYVVAPGRSAEEILGALRGRMDPAFLPRRMVLVDALPRDGLGKLPRQALAALGP